MSFKIVCSDIDGTLLDSRRELSARTIETFRALPDEVKVILASSRMPSAMTHLQRQLGAEGSPLICYNGGYVLQVANNSAEPDVIHSTWIPVDVCSEIVELTKGSSIHTSLYFEDEWWAPQWDSWTEREARITKVDPRIAANAVVLDDWRRRKVGGHKVMCMGPEGEIAGLERELNQRLSDHIHVYRSRPTYLELAPKSISKGTALLLLLKTRLNVKPEEVIAFGDNYNDVDLLALAGRGVAVANAREEVLSVADEVTVDSKEDGVAIALQKHFPLN